MNYCKIESRYIYCEKIFLFLIFYSKAKDAIKNCKVFVVQLELPLEINQEALKLAHSLGVKTILNTAPAPNKPLPESIYQYVDILCANQPELEMLTQLPASTREEAEIAAKKIISFGASQVLITLGAQGCLLITKSSENIFVEGKKVNAIDTSGAGDSFIGAFAYFYSKGISIFINQNFILKFKDSNFFVKGDDLQQSMEKANYVAAQSVTKKGTQSSYSSRENLPKEFFE